jgi:uncharacterized membrane protein YbhN (UPF0104 family)
MARNGRRGPILTAKAPVHWATAIFSMVPEGSVRRRPSDIVRIVSALFGLLILTVTTGLVPSVSKWVYELLADVPSELDWVLWLFYPAAIVAAVASVVIAAVVARRLALGLALLAAGLVSLGGALVLDATGGERVVDSLQSAGLDVSNADVAFPPVAFAVCVAVVLAAAPFLTRPTRRLMRATIAIGAVCAIAGSSALPSAIVAGLALGWGTAAAVHLALGTPRATPSLRNVARALCDFGIEIDRAQLMLDPDQVWGESRYLAAPEQGERLRISAVGRDGTDARLFAKVLRVIWYKDSGPPLTLTRSQQVEHGAFLLFLADRAGVAVPEVAAVGLASDAVLAVLVTREPEGPTFESLDESELTDDLLDAAWAEVVGLRDAHIAHGALLASTLVVIDERVALRDCSRMSSSSPPERLVLDQVDLLLATAAIVGVPRALAAAVRALHNEGVEALVPYLQASVLTRRAKKAVDDPKQLLTDLRDQAAAAVGVEAVEPTEVRRVAPATLAMTAGALLGVYLLLGELADIPDPAEVFANPDWGWVFVAACLSQLPQLTSAVAIRGSVAVQLPLGPVTALQFANNFTGLVGGTVATTALVVRFFQKQGQAVSVAVSSGLLNSLAAMMVQAVLLVTGLVIDGSNLSRPSSSGDSSSGSDAEIVGAIILGVAFISGVVLLIPKVRIALSARVRPQLRAGWENLRQIATDPRKPAALFGGNLCSQVLFAMTLEASLHAYGASLPLLEVIVVNSLASLVGGMAPVPGGMGVVEAGMIAGLTAFGVPQTEAIAATFTHRLFTAYLPPIWGWFSLQWLRHHDYV